MKLLFLFSILSAPLMAVTIHWGNAAYSENYDSDGNLLDMGQPVSSDLDFSLGYFDNSFVPTETNYDTWIGNWVELDAVSYNATNSFFSSTAVVDAPFPTGEKVYIWGRNQTVANPNLETILVSGVFDVNDSTSTDWVLPNINDPSQSNVPLEWRFSIANDIIVGAIETDQGGGDINNRVTTGVFQTATIIPEPSSLVLALLGLTALTFKRKR